MLVKYIDSNYIIETLQKPSWGEVEEPDFYITMASNRVKALIFPSEQGDPNNLASYNEEQQEAIKLATAIYTLWYFDTNYDFTNGSVSVNFGGVSMSESKTYNGEMVLPNVFDILKQANLIPTTETFIFNNTFGSFDNVNINPEAFKDLQQEMERQADNNIRQDGEIVKIYDRLSRIPTNEEQQQLKAAVEAIQDEQQVQNTNIQANTNKTTDLQNQITENTEDIAAINEEVSTNKTDIANLGNKVNANEAAIQTNTNKIQENKNNITILDSRLLNVSGLLNQTIDGLRTLKPFEYVGEFQQGTSYKTNQLVSLNNNLYLSKEDNNTTTPPSNKWLLLDKDFASIDLNNYYTKLEVEQIKTTLENNITSNTNNIANLNNEVVKIAGDQTITGVKRFNNQVVITHGFTPLTLRPSAPGKTYMLIQGADNITNFSLGANSSNTSLEVNRGDLTIKTMQANKNIAFENAARIKFNRSVLEMGTEINAGFGGGEVKFIPEDNSTKTLQFYNANPNDTRRFKLLVPEPTEAQNPTTKAYVDNKVNTNTTNITTIRNNYLDKTATGVQQIAAGSVYFNNQVIINQPYNPILTPSADLYVSGQGFIENFEADNATFNTSVIVPTPTQNNQAANKQYVDNAIQNITPGSGGSIDTSNFVTLNTIQTINGTKTFAMKILANAGITNLPTPTDIQDAANKFYVDNKVSAPYRVVWSTTSVVNNLNTSTFTISNYVDSNSSLKSWMIQFDRQGQNGNTYEGTINVNFMLPSVGQATFAGSTLWYNSSNKRFEEGRRVGITIERINSTQLKLTYQCWDGSNRIKNIKLLAPPA